MRRLRSEILVEAKIYVGAPFIVACKVPKLYSHERMLGPVHSFSRFQNCMEACYLGATSVPTSWVSSRYTGKCCYIVSVPSFEMATALMRYI